MFSAISEDEKISLKRSLISNFSEPIQQIATQKAVLVSKIARSDCPKEWPELLPTLIQAVESSDSLIQHRGLLTLHNVIKALSSKRLAGYYNIIYYIYVLVVQVCFIILFYIV